MLTQTQAPVQAPVPQVQPTRPQQPEVRDREIRQSPEMSSAHLNGSGPIKQGNIENSVQNRTIGSAPQATVLQASSRQNEKNEEDDFQDADIDDLLAD